MNLRQEKFVREYLATGNASEAARRAGYSKKTAEVIGCRLLRDVKVCEAIDKARKQYEDDSIASLTEAKQVLTKIIRAKLSIFIMADGGIDVKKVRAAGPELCEYIKDPTPNGTRTKIKIRDPITAIERLAKLNGWDSAEQHDLHLDLDSPLVIVHAPK